MIKIKVFKLEGFGSSNVSERITDFIASVDVLEFVKEGGAVSEPFMMSEDGKSMIFKYLNKGEGLTVAYQVERLEEQIQSSKTKRIQAGLNLIHAATIYDKAKNADKALATKAIENRQKAEDDIANIDFDINAKTQILADIKQYGFDDKGDIAFQPQQSSEMQAEQPTTDPFNPDLVYYGPHDCAICLARGVCTTIAKAGNGAPSALEFNYPKEAYEAKVDGEAYPYPNTHPNLIWERHKHYQK